MLKAIAFLFCEILLKMSQSLFFTEGQSQQTIQSEISHYKYLEGIILTSLTDVEKTAFAMRVH